MSSSMMLLDLPACPSLPHVEALAAIGWRVHAVVHPENRAHAGTVALVSKKPAPTVRGFGRAIELATWAVFEWDEQVEPAMTAFVTEQGAVDYFNQRVPIGAPRASVRP